MLLTIIRRESTENVTVLALACVLPHPYPTEDICTYVLFIYYTWSLLFGLSPFPGSECIGVHQCSRYAESHVSAYSILYVSTVTYCTRYGLGGGGWCGEQTKLVEHEGWREVEKSQQVISL